MGAALSGTVYETLWGCVDADGNRVHSVVDYARFEIEAAAWAREQSKYLFTVHETLWGPVNKEGFRVQGILNVHDSIIMNVNQTTRED